jgi:hypothetical protein
MLQVQKLFSCYFSQIDDLDVHLLVLLNTTFQTQINFHA